MNSKTWVSGRKVSCLLGAAASLLAGACSVEVDTLLGDASEGEVDTISEAVMGTQRVRLRVYTLDSGFNKTAFQTAVSDANAVFAPANIQFDFDPNADVYADTGVTCPASADTEKQAEIAALLNAVGDTVVGEVAVFYCPGYGTNEADWVSNRVIISSSSGMLSHELGHYFGLSHVHGEWWVPQEADLTQALIDEGYHSAEECIAALLDKQPLPEHCPAGPTTGLAMRDKIFDGDGLSDTGITVATLPKPTADHQCEVGFKVPLLVKRANGTTVDYSFSPLRDNPMGYFPVGCAGLPLRFSAQQVAVMRDSLLWGHRNVLIAKRLRSWDTSFSDANGWNLAKHYSTIALWDVSNDGRSDVCGRGGSGIYCAVSTGSKFGSATLWNGSFSDANGWGSGQYYSTIRYPNVNGTGGRDVCGRGSGGVVCATSNGSSFNSATTWASSYSDANGWNSARYYSTLDFPQLNSDSRADLCGRGGGGIVCALSTGSSFGTPTTWNSSFSDGNGWTSIQYYSTIKFPNVNGSGGADVCGRGGSGIYCATNNGSSFTNTSLWSADFSDANGWTTSAYYSTIAFPDLNDDGKADVCGRGGEGIWCGISNGSSFTNVQLWSGDFSDANGWTSHQYYDTITYVDIDRDGRADVCGRGEAGLYCAYSNGSSFQDIHIYTADVSDAYGWDLAPYYKTLMFGNPDSSDAARELCVRGASGILCE